MKNVNIKLIGLNEKVRPYVLIDNQPVYMKKNQYASHEINYQTDKDEIEIKVYKDLELKNKLWLLFAFLSFIFSIFGIFEPRYDKKCIIIDCVYKFKLNNEINDVNYRFNTIADGNKVSAIETNCETEEISNIYKIDKVAKKRWKILLAFKIVFWIVLAIVSAYLISKKI